MRKNDDKKNIFDIKLDEKVDNTSLAQKISNSSYPTKEEALAEEIEEAIQTERRKTYDSLREIEKEFTDITSIIKEKDKDLEVYINSLIKQGMNELLEKKLTYSKYLQENYVNQKSIIDYYKNSLKMLNKHNKPLQERVYELQKALSISVLKHPFDYLESIAKSISTISDEFAKYKKMQDDANRMKKLELQLHNANYEYYILNDPKITDYEYDKLFRELLELEREYPGFISPNSPTQKIGSDKKSSFEKTWLKQPMLSLGNAFSIEDLKNFDSRVKKKISDHSYHIEPKLDGLAISLSYQYGEFFIGLTRGDGEFGENISENLRTIKSIPLKLIPPFPETIEVRGEIVMNESEFIRINKERAEEGLPPFANSRNAASGSVRQLDPQVTAGRKLDFYAFHIGEVSENFAETQSETLEKLTALGFKVVPMHKHAETIDEAWEQIQIIEKEKSRFPFGTDGAVIKVEEIKHHETLGATSHEPRWAIAFKFPPDEKETKITDIALSVGRTGAITPVAEFEPVFLEGSTISRASLHNEDEVKRLDIRVGDTVIVRKAGSVIPEIVRVVKEKRLGDEEEFIMPEKCPVCGSSTIREEDSAYLKCTNHECPAQVKERILFFLARGNADIDGLGDVIVESLVSAGILNDISDLFTLTKEDLFTAERMGDVLAEKILRNIANAKNINLTKLISGLGIPLVGKVASKLLHRISDQSKTS
ncbi:MAG: NAD-dependent DNA ligase LigA [Caldisericia bacterium]